MKVVDTGGGFVHMVEVTVINFHDVIAAAMGTARIGDWQIE